jgi:hypothetical protein
MNRAEAIRFALFEKGNRRRAVMIVPGILAFDMSGAPIGTPLQMRYATRRAAAGGGRTCRSPTA